MDRLTPKDEVLAALASMPDRSATPVQIIKMLFLIEKQVSERIGGTNFHFVPYDYGPFDQSVYSELEALRRDGLIEIIDGRPRIFVLTAEGSTEASKVLARLEPIVVDFFSRLGTWITGLTFSQLVSAIYNKYPEMRANSVFRG
jgi:hypothetical protein